MPIFRFSMPTISPLPPQELLLDCSGKRNEYSIPKAIRLEGVAPNPFPRASDRSAGCDSCAVRDDRARHSKLFFCRNYLAGPIRQCWNDGLGLAFKGFLTTHVLPILQLAGIRGARQ